MNGDKLKVKISLAERILTYIVALILLLGILIVISWYKPSSESVDMLAMIERILLVLCGMLGSAISSIFERDTKDKRG